MHGQIRFDFSGSERCGIQARDRARRDNRAMTRTFLLLTIALATVSLALGAWLLYDDRRAIEPAAASESLARDRDGLVRHLARNARDGRAWVLLARIDFAADRFGEAADAYAKALAAAPKVAADPGIWCEYADALGMAQGGTLEGKPRELIERALALDPAHPRALEMAGSAAYEQQDYESALRNWQALLARLPADSREHRELTAAIERVEALTLAAGAPRGTPR
jgi:cytochrome c-type biogenesis protein CcmH